MQVDINGRPILYPKDKFIYPSLKKIDGNKYVLECPEGCEVDEIKTKIFIKKKEYEPVKWNSFNSMVEVCDEGENFYIDISKPSFLCSWNYALKYFNSSPYNAELPNVKQMKIIIKHVSKINEIILRHNGYPIEFPDVLYGFWTREKHDTNFIYTVKTNGNVIQNYENNVALARAIYRKR